MPSNRRLTLLYPLLYAAVFLGVLGLHARFWWPFYSDDALISLRYAQRLIEGRGLNWNDGLPRVEGYSNLLWTLLAAALGALRVDLILATRAMGVACFGVVLYAVARWQLSRACPRASILTLSVALAYFVLSGPVGIWAIGGLEQPLVAALLALALPLAFRLIEAGTAPVASPSAISSASSDPSDLSDSSDRSDPSVFLAVFLALSFVLGLLCITRPDGPLFSVAVFFGIALGRIASGRPLPPARKLCLLLPSFPILLYGGQLAFRLAYYGEWVPNTALVKVSPAAVHFDDGVRYVLGGLASLMPFSALAGLALLGCLFSRARRGRAVLSIFIVLLWTPYIVYIGGDIHPAHRHLNPLLVVFTFALVDALDALLGFLERRSAPLPALRRAARLAVPVLLLAGLFPYVILQTTHRQNTRVADDTWVWNGEVTATLLRRAFGQQQPTVAVTAAGCIPYWSGLPALDMLGLNDHYLPRHPPAHVGEGYLGHELGDAEYVLSRRPDIVVFHTGMKTGLFYAGESLYAHPDFMARYAPVRFLGAEPHRFAFTLWIDRESPRIGVIRSDTEIEIPGFLFQSEEHGPVVLNDADSLVLPLAAGQSAAITLSGIPPGEWIAGARVRGGARPVTGLRRNGDALTIDLAVEGSDPVELESLILRRN